MTQKCLIHDIGWFLAEALRHCKKYHYHSKFRPNAFETGSCNIGYYKEDAALAIYSPYVNSNQNAHIG